VLRSISRTSCPRIEGGEEKVEEGLAEAGRAGGASWAPAEWPDQQDQAARHAVAIRDEILRGTATSGIDG
jgi:hypothetical protein